MAAVDVISSIEIGRPRAEVAEFASDPDNVRKWYVKILDVEWRTPKPATVGSRIAFKARFLGRDLSYTYEITELVPGSKLVMRSAEGPFPMETTYEWAAVDENTTLMTLRNRGEPAGFSRVFAPFMAAMIKKANQKDLQLLKAILESDRA